MIIKVKLEEMLVRKNFGKIMKNVNNPRVTPKSAKFDMISNPQNSVTTNTGKDLKISKNRLNRYGGRVDSRTSEKNIWTARNVGQFDIGQLRYGTSLVPHFGSLKFSDK